MTHRSGTGRETMTEARMTQSLRHGSHATVFEVRRDPKLNDKDVIRDKSKRVFPFVSGSQYKGEWLHDQKEGFGVQVNPDNTKYEGEWKNGNYHGRGTLWVKKRKNYIRTYVGNWNAGRMSGQGIYYHPDGNVYRGEWIQNVKSGPGKMEYSNGDIFTGEWVQDRQHGFGTANYANGNVYEGLWFEGKKEGPGIFYYASTRKIYQGEWTDDQPRCGEFRAPTSAEDMRFAQPLPRGIYANDFTLPDVGLANPQQVLDVAITSTRMLSSNKVLSRANTPSRASFTREQIERAEQAFHKLAVADTGNISVHDLGEVLEAMGLVVNLDDLISVTEQLSSKSTFLLSLADVTEIAAYLLQLPEEMDIDGEDYEEL